VVITDGTAWVYNLTVDEAHTYFVGDGAWLVHNACRFPNEKKYNWSNRVQVAIDKFNNTMDYVLGKINRDSKQNHFTIARLEAQGQVTGFDHITELQNAYRGLKSYIDTIAYELREANTALSRESRDELWRRFRDIDREKTRLHNFLKKIGHLPE
jgi:hypothetical protein